MTVHSRHFPNRTPSLRYYLSTCESALVYFEKEIREHPELAKAQAELARGWVYYGLKLFEVSKEGETERICDDIFEAEFPEVGKR